MAFSPPTEAAAGPVTSPCQAPYNLLTNYYLAKMLPQSLPASLDWRVLGFAVALTGVIGLIIGLVPVIHTLRTNLAAIIQSSSRSASSSRGVRALSGTLVVTQVAVALILLTGAGLLIQSFAQAFLTRKRRPRVQMPVSSDAATRKLRPCAGIPESPSGIPPFSSLSRKKCLEIAVPSRSEV